MSLKQVMVIGGKSQEERLKFIAQASKEECNEYFEWLLKSFPVTVKKTLAAWTSSKAAFTSDGKDTRADEIIACFVKCCEMENDN